MKKRIYGIVSVIFFLVTIIILSAIDKTDNIILSHVIQVLFILYMSRITWGCLIHIEEQYKKQKYSYSIVMNLGLVLFLIINIYRNIVLFFSNLGTTNINSIYINTLNSFSYFVIIVLPLVIGIAVFCIITNIILIVKEGFRKYNLLGIMFGLCIIIGSFSSQIIYKFIENIELEGYFLYFKEFVNIGLNSILCYFYCLTIATLYCNVMASRHKPSYDKDFIIILGAKIRDDGTLTPILKGRVDKAIEFAKEQKEKFDKDIVFIPSGGQGNDEVMSEAEAMKNYLIENGIAPENIIIENESTSTRQNMRFSNKKIKELNEDGKIIFSTTNYHVFRSGVIANDEGMDCEGIGSKTKWYFYTNALVREFFANLFSQRKEHFILITLINISLFVLIIIGYHYNLISF